jgi:predicted site-specific integrase-resolvase
MQDVQQAPPPCRRVLWAQDLRERWGVSLATLWRWRRAGLIPQPDFMDTGWRLNTIEIFEASGGIPARSARSRPARHK